VFLTGAVAMGTTRWVTLTYSVFVSICASLTYTFGIYSEHLKAELGFNQEQIALVGTLGNVAQFTGLPAGMVYDRYGPRVTLLGGGCLAFTGFSLMYLATAREISVGLWGVAAFYALACFSMSWYDTSNVITNVRNFPGHRGVVIGMCKAFNGVGAGIFAQLYLGLFKPHSGQFLLLVPFYALAVALGGAILVRVDPSPAASDRSTRRNFALMYAGTFALSLYLAASALAQERWRPTGSTPLAITVVMLGLLLTVWLIPCLPEVGGTPEVAAEAKPLEPSGGDESSDPPSVPLLDALRGPAIWLLFFSFLLTTGVGLMLINNVAQIAASLGGPDADNANTRSVLVSLLGVGSTIGRLGCGALSERVLPSIPRPAVLTVVIAAHGASQLILARGSLTALFPACLAAGMCYGGYWALMPAICADLFGVRHLGAIYNFLHFAPSGGALLLSTLVPGRLYDREALRQGSATTCYGPECFRDAFLVNAAACTLASGLCHALFLCSRRKYSALH